MTYDPTKVTTEALHAVRALIQDTQGPDIERLKDEEIALQLAKRALVLNSNPTATWSAIHYAAADCCEMIAAQMSANAGLPIEGVAIAVSTSAREYRNRALWLRDQAQAGARPTFANPSAYPEVHVTGVDPLPALES